MCLNRQKKLQIGKDQEKAQPERDSHSKKPIQRDTSDGQVQLMTFNTVSWSWGQVSLHSTVTSHVPVGYD